MLSFLAFSTVLKLPKTCGARGRRVACLSCLKEGMSVQFPATKAQEVLSATRGPAVGGPEDTAIHPQPTLPLSAEGHRATRATTPRGHQEMKPALAPLNAASYRSKHQATESPCACAFTEELRPSLSNLCGVAKCEAASWRSGTVPCQTHAPASHGGTAC